MKSGILDKTRLTANVLMLVLVGLNIFFSIQYSEGIKRDSISRIEESQKSDESLRYSKFMKLFIEKVLGTNGTISFEDRVKLEADVIALGNPEIVKQWKNFVDSADSQIAQKNAVLLMSMLISKIAI